MSSLEFTKRFGTNGITTDSLPAYVNMKWTPTGVALCGRCAIGIGCAPRTGNSMNPHRVRYEFREPLRLLWLASKRAGCNKDLRHHLLSHFYEDVWIRETHNAKIEYDWRLSVAIAEHYSTMHTICEELLDNVSRCKSRECYHITSQRIAGRPEFQLPHWEWVLWYRPAKK